MSLRNNDESRGLGLHHVFSIVSVFLSVTALVIVAHISAKHTKVALHNDAKPMVIKPVVTEVIVNDQKDSDRNISGYEDVLRDIDELAQDHKNAPRSANRNKKASPDDDIAIDTKISEQYKMNNTGNSKHVNTLDGKIDMILTEESAAKHITKYNQPVKRVITPVKSPTFIKRPESSLGSVPNSGNSNSSSVTFYSESKDMVVEDIHSMHHPPKAVLHITNPKVQLGVFATHSEAIAGWFRIRNARLDIFGHLKYHIDKVQGERDGAELYRLYVNVENDEKARSICEVLEQDGVKCIVTN